MILSQITKPPDKIMPKVAGFPGQGGILMPPWPVCLIVPRARCRATAGPPSVGRAPRARRNAWRLPGA